MVRDAYPNVRRRGSALARANAVRATTRARGASGRALVRPTSIRSRLDELAPRTRWRARCERRTRQMERSFPSEKSCVRRRALRSTARVTSDRLMLKILFLAQTVAQLYRDERVERHGDDWYVRRRAPSEGFRDARVEPAETDE